MNFNVPKKFLLAFVILWSLFQLSTVQAKDSAIIIFDGSGSMWGQIEGKHKIEIAREVMGTLVEDWNEDIALGLMAYGHREKGNCADIEVLQPVGTPDSKKILNIINKLSPKGKTPISQSLKQAAETLRYAEDPATVILISDGEETCNADPCVVSKELEAKGINFTAHVIGFDVKNNQKAREQLRCIAENTGGQFYEAEDTSGLNEALVQVQKVVEDPRPTLCKQYAEEAVKHERTNIEKECGYEGEGWSTDTNVHFTWCMQQAIGSKLPETASQQRVTDLEKCAAEKAAAAQAAPAPELKPEPAGETGVKLSAVAAEGAEPFSRNSGEDVWFYVYEAKKTLDGQRKEVDSSHYARPVFQLSAGQYVIAAKRGNTRIETPIEVKAGELVEHQFVMNSGNLKLTASAAEGAEPFSRNSGEDVWFYVYEAKKTLDGQRKKVDSSHYARPVFQLSAGQYVIAAKRGNTRIETPIEVKAGELVEHQFVMNSGNLKLTASAAEGAEPFSRNSGEDVWFYVYEAKKTLDGQRKKVDSSHYARPVFQLSAGQYVIAAKRGNTRIETPIEVKAGELVEHQFVMNSGNLKLTASAAEGAEPFSRNSGEDVWFYVYEAKKTLDGQRKKVDSSHYARPVFQLSAGQYVIAAKRGNTRIETPIEVKAGELVEHQFVMNSGNLKLTASAAEGAEPFSRNSGEDVWFYVYEAKKTLDGQRKKVDSSHYARPVFQLSAGQYIVIAKRQGKQLEAIVDVKPGVLTEHAFVMSDAKSTKVK